VLAIAMVECLLKREMRYVRKDMIRS
jgi:hypothetical protein